MKKGAEEKNMERYAELEKIHLGDFEKSTGIYHPEVRAIVDKQSLIDNSTTRIQ